MSPNEVVKVQQRVEVTVMEVDLARKRMFLHDASVHGLDSLLDPRRGAKQPHPFYIADMRARADIVDFLKSLDTTTR